jgi:predicted nucleotidyltransferase
MSRQSFKNAVQRMLMERAEEESLGAGMCGMCGMGGSKYLTCDIPINVQNPLTKKDMKIGCETYKYNDKSVDMVAKAIDQYMKDSDILNLLKSLPPKIKPKKKSVQEVQNQFMDTKRYKALKAKADEQTDEQRAEQKAMETVAEMMRQQKMFQEIVKKVKAPKAPTQKRKKA